MLLKYLFVILLPFLALASLPCEKNKKIEIKDDCNKTKVVNKVKSYKLCSYKKLYWRDHSVSSENAVCVVEDNQVSDRNTVFKTKILNGFVWLFSLRFKIGTYSSLNLFKLSDLVDSDGNGFVQCPALECYPNCPAVQFFTEVVIEEQRNCISSNSIPVIVSAVDIAYDCFERYWVLDTNHVFDPSLNDFEAIGPTVICSFNTDGETEDCLILPEEYSSPSWTTLILTCDNIDDPTDIYFYVIGNNKIVVCYLKDNNCYEYRAPEFLPSPSNARFEVTLPNYKKYTFLSTVGINDAEKSDRGIFFTSEANNCLYHIPNSVLMNETLSKCELQYKIKKLGCFNDKGQSADFVRDEEILYFLQTQNNAVACVNVKHDVNPEAFQLITIDKDFSSLRSVQIYEDNTDCKKLYLFTDNRFDIKLNGFSEEKENFKFYYIDVKDIEKNYPGCLAHVSQLYETKSEYDVHSVDKQMYERYEIPAVNVQKYEKKSETSYPVFMRQPYYMPVHHAVPGPQHTPSCYDKHPEGLVYGQ